MTYFRVKCLFFLLVCGFAKAQKATYSANKIATIDSYTRILEEKNFDNNAIVKELAKKLKIDVARNFGNGRMVILKGVNEINEPIFISTESNLLAGQTTRTNSLYSDVGLGFGINGSSENMVGRLGIWDGGKVLASHQEFFNKISQIDSPSSVSDHATHVAGTMAATGINTNAKGMAFGAKLKAFDFSNDDAEMSAASKDLVVSNHSYGQITGWYYNDSRTTSQKWEWYGNNSINAFEDYKHGLYDSQSQNWDKIAYNAPNYLIVKSAGNKRNENGPGISKTDTTKTLEAYFLGSSKDSSFVARSKNDGYDILPTYSVSKNILTVGAVSSIPNGPSLSSDIKISSFSSWGPTDDGRIKPDIVGVGVNLLSTTSNSDIAYAYESGTSMSAPQVAGSIFLLQELHNKISDNQFLKSSRLKALVLHTATDAGRPGPDYIYGWGLLNMEKAAQSLLNREGKGLNLELNLGQGNTITQEVIASGEGPLVVTICWTDPEGTPNNVNAANFNNRIPKLVNDIDIRISDSKNEYFPWILDPNNPSKNATKGDNIRDNVEQVYIANPIPGKTYKLTVTHKSILKNESQAVGLIASGIRQNSYCLPNNNPATSKIESLKIGKLNYGGSQNCTAFVNLADSLVTISPTQVLPVDIKMGNCAGNKPKTAKIFVDWDTDGIFNNETELVATSLKLQNGESFVSKITAPANIISGKTTRGRIIISEADEDLKITPCGDATSQALDFSISYVNANTDLALNKVLFPVEALCQNSAVENLTFQVTNKGITNISKITFNINVLKNGKNLQEQQFEYNNPILALSNTTINIPISILPKIGEKYLFKINSLVQNDENSTNDYIELQNTVAADNVSITPRVVDCTNSNTVSLATNGQGAAFWYDAAIGGNLIGVGNNITIIKPIPNTLYATQNDISGKIGPITKGEYAGGSYSGNFGPKPIFKIKAPIVIESARLYIGAAGKITFTVERLSDLSRGASVTLDVKPTRDPKLGLAANGMQVDDVNDPGAIYNLGLEIPESGDYQIAIEYEDGATIFRSNQGVTGFPFSLQNAVNITGSTFNNTILTSAWYYFYNLKIKSNGCKSSVRTLAIKENKLNQSISISANGSLSLCPEDSSTLLLQNPKDGLNYQWFKNNLPLSVETKNKLIVNQKGDYYLLASDGGVCPASSNVITIATKTPQKPVIEVVGNVLTSSIGDSYQWYFEQNPISGATTQLHTAIKSGQYYVKAKVEGCLVNSFPSNVNILAEEYNLVDTKVSIFPNPVGNTLNIKILNVQNINDFQYHIYNAKGQLIDTLNNKVSKSNSEINISLFDFKPDFYLLWFKIGKDIYIKKFIKQ